ncbi:Mucin-like protein, partial [Trichoplax sp. H2]
FNDHAFIEFTAIVTSSKLPGVYDCSVDINLCHVNAICTNTSGLYNCLCESGFTGNGTYCTDINECLDNLDNCSTNATCINTSGSFNCSCNQGYLGDGVTCVDINECQTGTDHCHTNASCQNTIGSYACLCKIGFTGNGTTCNDIDECLMNQSNCHSKANCVNSIGSYACSCIVGYTGNGRNCQDINECTTNNQCHSNSTCNNTIGSYTCSCMSGFEGNGTYCQDIDECSTNQHQCHHNATCINLYGSYECSCSSGFLGNGRSCSDINECNSGHTCSRLATCYNTPGSYYCVCNYGLQGNGFQCVQEATRLYPYGAQFGDRSFGRTDQGYRYLYLREPISYMQTSYRGLYISVDGVISLGFPYPGFTTRPFPRPLNRAIIAPYFADSDLRRQSVSHVYYQQYLSYQQTPISDEILRNATNDVNRFQQLMANDTNNALYGIFRKTVNNFTATHVVVITWYKLVAYPYWYYWNRLPREYNTFQLVLISNGKNLFSLFNYEINGFNWWKRTPWIRARIGYSYGLAPYYYEIPWSQRRNTKLLRIDQYRGNTGEIGKWAFRVDDPDVQHVNYATQCSRWYNAQAYSIYYRRSLPACPCRAAQAIADPRFRYNRRTGCATSRFSFPGWGWRWTWPSRYSNLWSRPPRVWQRCCYSTNRNRAGALIRSYPTGSSFVYVTRSLRLADEEAYKACCKLSRLCNLYQNRRPIDTCRNYRPPRWSWMWGDPHIQTLDGKSYTFNGVGEYTLLESDNSFFTLQGRTRRPYITNTTQLAKGSVFSAFAMSKNDSDTVEVKLNAITNTVTITVNKNSTYNDTHLLNDTVLSFNNLEISKQDTKYLVSFTSGHINASSSLFSYSPGMGTGNYSDPSFIPNFSKDINVIFENNTEIRDQAIQLCKGDSACLFDAAETLSIPAAVSGKNISQAIATTQADIIVFPPTITGQSIFNVTYGQTFTTTLNATDPNGKETLTVTSVNLPLGASVDNQTNTFTWDVSTYENLSFEFAVTNSKNLSAIFKPSVVMCYCANNGTCQYEAGWVGTFCTERLDECAGSPCYENVTCTLVPAPGIGFTCGPCPGGLQGDGEKCFDINECETGDNLCNQTCINTVGNYSCQCQAGFELDTNNLDCKDIDECAITQRCHQICVNDYGSYSCECRPGYTLNSDNKTCSPIVTCNSTASNCTQLCAVINNTITCSCNLGYSLATDQVTCIDENECENNPTICADNCTNTEGSYYCSCRTGYQLNTDRRTCRDIDECSNSGLCPSNSICVNSLGSFSCDCVEGFIATGGICQDIDECIRPDLNLCSRNAICVNFAGSYNCLCDSGFQGNGIICADINECSNANICAKETTCNNLVGSYQCICNNGYTGNGTVCTDINECDNSSSCRKEEICHNTLGSYYCTCKKGFYTKRSPNATTTSCQAGLYYTGLIILNGTFTTDLNNPLSQAYLSLTSEAYSKVNAALMVDVRTQYAVQQVTIVNLRLGNGTILIDLSVTLLQNSTFVTLQLLDVITGQSVKQIRSYPVQSIIFQDYNQCADPQANSCSNLQNCTQKRGSFECHCISGYQLDSQTNQCQDIDECLNSSTLCANNSACLNTVGGFLCQCENGYSGDGITGCTFSCPRDRCQNGGTCFYSNGTFLCNCLTGFDGPSCESTNLQFTSQTIIIAIGSAGGILILLLMLIVIGLWYRRRKDAKYKIDPPDESDDFDSFTDSESSQEEVAVPLRQHSQKPERQTGSIITLFTTQPSKSRPPDIRTVRISEINVAQERGKPEEIDEDDDKEVIANVQ